MKSKKNLVFIGMMGSGKTSIGSLVSKKLKLNFFDIDAEIEKELDMKISKIFQSKGEIFFRKLEEKITLKFLKNENGVFSLGGGAFNNEYIQNEVLKNNLSFWLKWGSKTLINRIKNSEKRPIAFKSTDEELIDLIKKRSNIYAKALYKINCENKTKLEITNKILKIYETYSAESSD
jgi:shikimate kinase/shikimate kinase/3-dehydroquinate synthase